MLEVTLFCIYIYMHIYIYRGGQGVRRQVHTMYICVIRLLTSTASDLTFADFRLRGNLCVCVHKKKMCI